MSRKPAPLRQSRPAPRPERRSAQERLSAEQRRMSARCDEWAARAVHYRREGELRKAERAEERAFYYLRRMKLLQDRTEGKPWLLARSHH